MSAIPDYASYIAGELPAKGFLEGDLFEASAAGDEVAAFAMALNAPEIDNSIEIPAEVKLFDDKDTVITWKKGVKTEKIMLILNFGWHGAPPETMIFCEAPDAAEKIVISKEISTLAPLAGGPSLLPHPSYLFKMNSKETLVDGKLIEFLTAYGFGVSPIH